MDCSQSKCASRGLDEEVPAGSLAACSGMSEAATPEATAAGVPPHSCGEPQSGDTGSSVRGTRAAGLRAGGSRLARVEGHPGELPKPKLSQG